MKGWDEDPNSNNEVAECKGASLSLLYEHIVFTETVLKQN